MREKGGMRGGNRKRGRMKTGTEWLSLEVAMKRDGWFTSKFVA